MGVQIEKIHLRDAANNWVALPSWTYTNNGTTTSISELFVNNKKVTQAVTTANGNYPVILKASTATATATDTTIFGSKITANPSTGNLNATKFNNLTLSAATTGFTISGGTTSTTTLTVPTSVTIAAAAGYNVSNTVPVNSTSAKLPTCSAVAAAIVNAVPVPGTEVGTTITSGTATAGTAAAYARADHVHNITSAAITNALGYTPPQTDTNTHYISKNIIGKSNTATANAASTSGSIYLNHLEESTVKSSHKITPTGATTIVTDSDGNITISSTDTTYSTIIASEATAGTVEDGKLISAKVLHGERASWYGVSDTSSSTTDKAVVTTAASNGDFDGYKLKKGTQVIVNFTQANTVRNAIRLNVGGTGAKSIWLDGATVSSGNQFLWDADTDIEFVYDGTYYRVVSAPISNSEITAIFS